MIFACSTIPAGVFMWAIIRKPVVSMPSSRAKAMCWGDTSASVQWVATWTLRAPTS
jgi:hypothetical protein